MASFNMVTRIDGTEGFNSQSIEERNFQAALIMTECHFTRKPPIGRKTVNMTLATIKRTMEKTLNVSEIRYGSMWCYVWARAVANAWNSGKCLQKTWISG